MFNYLFPLFCFGVVITGIVLIGILQASEQLKADLAERARVKSANRLMPVGAIKSKPTWWNPSGVPPRRLFCFVSGDESVIRREAIQYH